jgi:hypothetical protein
MHALVLEEQQKRFPNVVVVFHDENIEPARHRRLW